MYLVRATAYEYQYGTQVMDGFRRSTKTVEYLLFEHNTD